MHTLIQLLTLHVVLLLPAYSSASPREASITTSKSSDVYLIIYLTSRGKTGHAGVAIDHYDLRITDSVDGNRKIYRTDTVPSGTLLYYDLWPREDYFSASRTGKDIPPRYYKLPCCFYGDLTLSRLRDEGIPHQEGYPCDGIIRLRTSAKQDYGLVKQLDSLLKAERPFNARRYNCSDFAKGAIEFVTGLSLQAKEFIPFSFSTTPNKLYRVTVRLSNAEVIKIPNAHVNRSFLREKIVYLLKKRIGRMMHGNTHSHSPYTDTSLPPKSLITQHEKV